MSYSRAEIHDKILEAAEQMAFFYNAKCVAYRGKTKSPNPVWYTELISEWLLNNFNKLTSNCIKTIPRKSPYMVPGHDCAKYKCTAYRLEEHIAMGICLNKNIAPLGEILDYQIPLKDSLQDKGVGKIDLISFDKPSGILRILELKRPRSQETLLRCVLEAYTYRLTVDVPKLVNDFKLSNFQTVKACPLFFEGSKAADGKSIEKESRQYKEYRELLAGKRPMLRELMRRLDIELFMLEELSSCANGQPPQYSAKKLPF